MRPAKLFFLALAAIIFAGCNVFEGLYEEGASDDPIVLIADADIALERGDTQAAVSYLEKAVQQDPNNIRARAKLSSTILKRDRIDVLLLRSVVDDFLPDGSASKSGSQRQACRYTDGPGVSATPIDYRTSSEYQQLLAAVASLQAAQANGLRLIEAVTASTSQNLSPSRYATAAARTQLFNAVSGSIQTEGLPESIARSEAAAFLIAFGLAEFTISILDLDSDLTTNQIQWVRLTRNGADAGLSICAPTQAQLDAMAAAVSCEIPQFQSGGIAFRTRAESLGARVTGGSNDQSLSLEMADEVDQFVADFQAEFSATTCS